MFTTDLALKEDPAYRKIAKRFQENPEEYQLAFAKAWFKLTHRDLGPRARYLGAEVPKEVLTWQDPVPAVDHALIDANDAAALKAKILASGLTDVRARPHRVGFGRIVPRHRHARRRERRTHPAGAAEGLGGQRPGASSRRCCRQLEAVRKDFNRSLTGGKQVSLADTIVLGGNAAIEQAAKSAGHDVKVPFTPGRTDASQEQTDVAVVRAARAVGGWLPQLLRRGCVLRASRRRRRSWIAQPC